MTKTWSFDEILAPVKTEDFFTRMLGKSCLHLKGNPEKFSSLLSWPDINRILCLSGLDLSRVRVSDEAGDVTPERFTRSALSGFSRIHLADLNHLLADGAVLSIDAAEDIHSPIREFSRAIERALKVPVQAQIRFSCSATRHEEHSYDHDMIACGVLGSSSWCLSRKSGSEMELDPSGDSESPVVDPGLNPGELIYVPRGQMHSDRFVNEPAVLIAIIFKNPTGVEITGRLFDRLKEADIVKQDVPRFASDEVKAAYLTALQYEIIRISTEPGLLLGLMRDLWSISEPTRLLGLPWSATGGLTEDLELVSAIRFPHEDSLIYSEGENVFEIIHEGTRVRLDCDSANIVDCVLRSGIVSIGKLAENCSIPRQQLLNKLSAILRLGIIIVREPDAD